MTEDKEKQQLTHVNEKGEAHMVDVSEKAVTPREARAQGEIVMRADVLMQLMQNELKKGDALAVARVAGIQAMKKTSDLIPLCHPLLTTFAEITFDFDQRSNRVIVQSCVRVSDKTGAEMEALTGVTIALLTLYDMLKGIQKDLVISEVKLIKKTGGKSGDYILA